MIKSPMKMSRKSSRSQTFPCGLCNYSNDKRYLLTRHMISHSEERPHKCPVCERGFKTAASLQNHVNVHTGTKPHKCKFCNSAFTTSGELSRHRRYKHLAEKPFSCSLCIYSCVESHKLRLHMRAHTGERPYQCEHCTYASSDTCKLKRHMRKHTREKPYECETCKMRFTQSNSLKSHKLIHLNEKPSFPCALCPTTCGRQVDLRMHVQRLHSSGETLNCKRCNKCFADRYSFKQHSKTHKGEKCFKCGMCSYSSAYERHLNLHILVHTDEKPFVCDLCSQSFRRKQLLKRHQNLYHNAEYNPPTPQEKCYECQECRRQFLRKGNLIRHIDMHNSGSAVREKFSALKLGRQKKIYTLDTHRDELIMHNETRMDDPLGEFAEEKKEEINMLPEMLELALDNMDQYVVLEIIQIYSPSDTISQPAVMNQDYFQEQLGITKISSVIEKDTSTATKISNTAQDVKNWFGFDDAGAEEEEKITPEEAVTEY